MLSRSSDPVLWEMLERHEGRRRKVYFCPAGKLTIGVGRNLEDRGLSEEEIDFLLRNDIKYALDDLAGFPWWHSLTAQRQRVLIDMHLNLGPARFRGFKKMLLALEQHDYVGAALELLDSKAAKQDAPVRYAELAEQMRLG